MRGLLADIQRLKDVNNPKTIEELKERQEEFLKRHGRENGQPEQKQSEAKMKLTTTEGKLYFIAVDTLDRLEIQFVPQELNYQRKPNIGEIQIIGRNTLKFHNLGAQAELPLTLDFYATEEDRMDVINKCRWLEHLCISDGNKKPPQRVKLIWGDLFKDQVWVVKSVSYKLGNFNREKGFLPQQAYCDVLLGLVTDKNETWEDIRTDNKNELAVNQTSWQQS